MQAAIKDVKGGIGAYLAGSIKPWVPLPPRGSLYSRRPAVLPNPGRTRTPPNGLRPTHRCNVGHGGPEVWPGHKELCIRAMRSFAPSRTFRNPNPGLQDGPHVSV